MPPLQHLARWIYGINILRGHEEIMAAGEIMVTGLSIMKMKASQGTMLCGGCGEPMNKVKGMAQIHLQRGANIVGDIIPIGLCQKCLHDHPDNPDMARRVVITCTGFDPGPTHEFNRTLH